MLTECFIASIGVLEKAAATNVAKDAAIFVHEFQPSTQQRSLFKKSVTAPNCLVVSESHVFAAQSDKAVVHVYSREKGNQEATVPFTERITCITFACDDTVLVLGTAEGRIFLWEICTGRQVTTSQAHLQAVTVLAVDPTSNFLLSASADSTVHVWSILSILSFANPGTQAPSPLRTFTYHRAEITALAVGHSSSFSNFAVSTSTDRTCLIWDFHTNSVLRTYLLPSVPTCLCLDAADRAVYVGYEDGGVQQLDLYATGTSSATTSVAAALHNGEDATAPIQSSTVSMWKPLDASNGPTLSVGLSFDCSTLLSGHQSGAILAWDVTSGRAKANVLQNPMPGPVTNLKFLLVAGFLLDTGPKLKVLNVIKPRFGAFDSSNGSVPGNYAMTVELTSDLGSDSGHVKSAFQQALTPPSFLQSLLDEGLEELTTWANSSAQRANGHPDDDGPADFMALDGEIEKPRELTLHEQNGTLQAQLDAMRRLQTASFDKIEMINAERKALLKREQLRLSKHGALTNGRHDVEDSNDDDSIDDGD